MVLTLVKCPQITDRKIRSLPVADVVEQVGEFVAAGNCVVLDLAEKLKFPSLLTKRMSRISHMSRYILWLP